MYCTVCVIVPATPGSVKDAESVVALICASNTVVGADGADGFVTVTGTPPVGVIGLAGPAPLEPLHDPAVNLTLIVAGLP